MRSESGRQVCELVWKFKRQSVWAEVTSKPQVLQLSQFWVALGSESQLDWSVM